MKIQEFIDQTYSKYPLIGNCVISEKNLKVINNEAKKAVDLMVNTTDRKLTSLANMIVALSVVNYAKKWNSSDESKFTKYIAMQFGYREDASGGEGVGKIWGIVSDCIQKAMIGKGKLFIKDETGRQFVETALVHSLGPLNEWDTVFELLFDYLKINLRWDFIQSDPINRKMIYVLKNRFDGVVEDDEVLQIGSGNYRIHLGAKRLVQYDSEYAIELFEHIISRISSIVNNNHSDANQYIDVLIDEWYVRKLNMMLATEKKQITSIHRDYSETALSYEKIRARYKFSDTDLVVCTPIIRLENPEVQKAEEIIYISGKELKRVPLEVYGNELGKTINQSEVSLKDIGMGKPEIMVKIICDGQEIFNSGKSLYRKIVAIQNSREVSINSLKKGKYILYLPDPEAVEFENINVNKVDAHVYYVELKTDFSIMYLGNIMAMDTSSIQQAKILEPSIVRNIHFNLGEDIYEVIPRSENLRFYFDISKKASDFCLFINKKRVDLAPFIDKTVTDSILININFENISNTDEIVDLLLLDVEKSAAIFKHAYYLCSSVELSFNRNVYIKHEDYEYAELKIKIGNFEDVVSFGEGELSLTLPYGNGRFEISVPCIKTHWSNIKKIYAGNNIWYRDIGVETILHIDNYSDKVVTLEFDKYIFKKSEIKLFETINKNFKEASYSCPIVLNVGNDRYEIAQVVFSGMFTKNPVFTFEEKCLRWDGGINYIGEKSPVLELILYKDEEVQYQFPLFVGRNEVKFVNDFKDGEYTYQIIEYLDDLETIVAQDTQFLGSLNRIRFQNEILEIKEVTEDIEEGGKKIEIKPVYIENIKYVEHAYVPSEDGFFDIYEGRMYFRRADGKKKYFSSKYEDKYVKGKMISFYQVNPVKIIYINDQFIRIVNQDDEGILCFHNFRTTPSHEITDRELGYNTENIKDILFYIYKTKKEHTGDKENAIMQKLLSASISVQKSLFSKFETVSQNDIITAPYNVRILVNAGPGTGKTYTLIERIINLVNEQQIDPEEILILCFSRAAVEVIKNRLILAYENGRVNETINLVDVRTFDSFVSQVLYWVKDSESAILDSYNITALNYEERINLFNNTIKKDPELISQCSHLFVDEIQDLVKSRAHMVLGMINLLPPKCGITLLGDACQSIYDYQVNDEPMSSVQFYKVMIERKPGFSYYSLERNYRQDSQLAFVGDIYRKTILEGEHSNCDVAWNGAVSEYIKKYEIYNFEDVEQNNLLRLAGEGTIGILTRTNGQALKISSMLRKKGIEHSLKKRLSDASLCGWLACFLNEYQYMAIDYNDFKDVFFNYSNQDSEAVWTDIVSCMERKTGKIGIREMLRGILASTKGNTLYRQDDDSPIMVTNIHRGKGREFDTVLVEDSIFSEKEKVIGEHKVCYVAITRPKNQIYRIKMQGQYMRIDKDGDRRCYEEKFGHNGNRHLAFLEVGLSNDVDLKSCVRLNKVQEFLRETRNSIKGEQVVLIKDTYTDNYVSYRIYYPNADIDLGKTSREFSVSLERVLKSIYNLPEKRKVYPNLFPRRLSEIYIDDVISVIDESDGSENGVKNYGEMVIWNAISIVGYAKTEYE